MNKATPSLDDKLHELISEIGYMCPADSSDVRLALKEIRQAFIDEGWIPYKPTTDIPEEQKPSWWSRASYMTVDEHKARIKDLMTKDQWEQQAIKDGWTHPIVYPIKWATKNQVRDSMKKGEYHVADYGMKIVESNPLMTGQEWYDRAKKELENQGGFMAKDDWLDTVLKKAAGIDNE